MTPQDPNQTPHPNKNPVFSKGDYIRNNIFAQAKMMLGLYLSEGASLHEASHLTRELQEVVRQAYHVAVHEAGLNVAGPQQPGLSDDNPFNTN